MKSLKTLIRVHKNELDRMRRTMAELQDQREKFLDALRRLDEQLERERELAMQELALRSYFDTFSKSNRDTHKLVTESAQRIEGQIRQITIQITRKFEELKTYEIALKKAEAEELAEELHREQLELDDIGIDSHQRKNAE